MGGYIWNQSGTGSEGSHLPITKKGTNVSGDKLIQFSFSSLFISNTIIVLQVTFITVIVIIISYFFLELVIKSMGCMFDKKPSLFFLLLY